jgi:hypothetical protein
MLKLIFLFLSGVSVSAVYSQIEKVNFDLIITIDEKIPIGTISNFKFRAITENSSEIISVDYYPGNLSMIKDDYRRLFSDTIKLIFLDFDYYEYVGEKQHLYHYKIEYKKSWMREYFNILHIFNLDKKKYKKQFKLNRTNEPYLFELDSPGGTFHYVSK